MLRRGGEMATSYRPAFAWFPTRMDSGQWIWLRWFQSIDGGRRKRLYESM